VHGRAEEDGEAGINPRDTMRTIQHIAKGLISDADLEEAINTTSQMHAEEATLDPETTEARIYAGCMNNEALEGRPF
jgi:hypothetical protein